VAEGLATTSWLLYADMKTGIGPEMVYFYPHVRIASPDGAWFGASATKWITAFGSWEREGKMGRPPGTKTDKEPVRDVVEQRLADAVVQTKSRDYEVDDPRYILRPEVSLPPFAVFNKLVCSTTL
jgi:hypothetical protein